MRAEPCVNAEIPGCYPDGLELTIWGAIEHSGTYDWLAVEADGTQGWAVTDYLSFNRAAFPVTCNVPVHPLDTRTGVASVDALIAAVHPGDAQALARNIAGVQVACTLNAQGIGGPPPCEDGPLPALTSETPPAKPVGLTAESTPEGGPREASPDPA